MQSNMVDKLMQVFRNPIRSAILYELMRHTESSATELARVLNEKVNNIYYHLQILYENGIVNAPRSVVKLNYVEKYYSLSTEFLSGLSVGEHEWKQSQRNLPTEQRRQIAVTGLNLVASILSWRTKEYKHMTDEEIDALWSAGEEWVTLSTFTQKQYVKLLERLQDTWNKTIREFEKDDSKEPAPFTIIVVGLSPSLVTRARKLGHPSAPVYPRNPIKQPSTTPQNKKDPFGQQGNL